MVVGVSVGVFVFAVIVSIFLIRKNRESREMAERLQERQRQRQRQRQQQETQGQSQTTERRSEEGAGRSNTITTTPSLAQSSPVVEEKRRALLEYFLTHREKKTIAKADFILGSVRSSSQQLQRRIDNDAEAGENANDNNGYEDTAMTSSSATFSLGSGSFVADHVQVTSSHQVSGCCAVCLSNYRIGDCVVWSSLSDTPCQHAFHFDCIMDWLASVKDKDKYPCPCCRQQFISMS